MSMIWTIARRELFEYVKSLRFLIGFLITIALMTISTIINLNDFKQRQQDYDSAREEMKGDQFYVRVYRPPEELSTLVQGKDRTLGNRLEMTYMSIPPKTTGYMGEHASQHHRYVAGFSSVDFAFTVRIILSLMVIFLTYNVVSGEKLHGTLRMVLAHPVPRHVLLLGKCIGGLIIILICLAVSMMISLLILALDPLISIGGAQWIRLLCMFGASALYVACFFTLGLFISVIVNRPSIALTLLLQIWIVTNLIYPALAAITAESVHKLPGDEELARRKQSAFQPYKEQLAKTDEEFRNTVIGGGQTSTELWLRQVELAAKQAATNQQVDREFGYEQTRQLELARTLSLLSPAALYDEVMVRYARTGMEEFERFMDAVARRWQEHVDLTKAGIQHPEERAKQKSPAFGFLAESTAESIMATLPRLVILFLHCILFLVLAFTAFLRKDVR
jgi:ABC-type transport system involved in multi-copper enzyme maturation permease subunit